MAPILAPTVKLNNGYEMPILGLGTYMLRKSRGLNALRAAIDIGYRHIDTAYLYRNEKLVGQAMHEKIKAGIVQRENMFIVTKLWDIFHEPQHVEHACRKQLTDLGTNYIDLYLMHSPVGYKYVDDEALMPHDENGVLQTNSIDYIDTYKAMENLVDLGLVRSLGLSNFNHLQLQRVLDNCRIKPVNLQIECHPLLNQHHLNKYCRDRDIIVTSYSPLARVRPTKPMPKFLTCPRVLNIAKKYNKTPCQVVLRYLVDIGTVPIPKTATETRLLENIDIFDFILTLEEIANLDEFNTGERIWKMEKAQQHKFYPYR